MGARIQGSGIYIPENSVDNFKISRYMDTSDEWIRERTGILKRHFAKPNESTSDLAYKAVLNLSKENGFDINSIDCIVFATMTPDTYIPGSAPYLQKKLNLSKIPCIEVKGQCAGFLYGMQISNSLILTGIYKKILLIGAEVHTCLFPYEPLKPILEGTNEEISRENYEFNTKFRDRMVLFGDGAGAFLMEKGSDGEGILDSLLYTDGNFIEKLYIKAGGSKSRPYFSKKDYEDGNIIPILEGREVYKLAVTLMTEVVLEILEKNGLKISDIDLLLMHQANLRINEAVQKRLGLPNEKVYNNIQKYGNTTAATLPLVYYEAKKEGKIKKGDLVCFVALGSGLHWGALLYKE